MHHASPETPSDHHNTPSGVFAGPIYHVFPLGLLGAPRTQPPDAEPVPPDDPRNIRAVADWIPHLTHMEVEAVLFGPIFSAESHGYDTVDLTRLDPRLGTNEDFVELSAQLHHAGISVLLDAVLNHVGRGFFAFQDVLEHRDASVYRNWFSNLRFDRPGPAGDGVDYDTWDGHGELVKLNLSNPEARRSIVDVVTQWIHEFDIDGLRLDAADVIDPSLWPELREVVNTHYRGRRSFGRGRF